MLAGLMVSVPGHAQQSAHWHKIWDATATTGDTSIPYAGYFWSPTHGMVGITSVIGDTVIIPRIFYTEDGINWIESSHPNSEFSASQGVQFSAISMQDTDTGWAALASFGTDTIYYNWVWKTTDGGKSWQGGQPYRVAGQGIVYNFGLNHFDSTLDFIGRSSIFTRYAGSGRGWISDSIGINSAGTGNLISKTTDAGRTWQQVLGIYEGPWGIYGSTTWRTFLTTTAYFRNRSGLNGFTGNGPFTNYPSTSGDSGRTWLQGTYPNGPFGNPMVTGDVEGGRDAVYVQTVNSDTITYVSQPMGLIRTTDTGRTWKNVGGPSNYSLSRFCEAGCTGATVIAFDPVGGVWLTTDGGDGALREHPAEPIFDTASLQLSALLCSDTTNGLRFTDDHCDAFTLLSVSFVDSALIKLGVLSFDTVPATPQVYGSDMSDTIGIRWTPGVAFSQDTTVTAQIDLHYLSGTDGLDHDTIISLTLLAKHGVIGTTLSATSIDFGSVSTCALADSIVTITNTGCEATTVDSISINGVGFSILSYDSIIGSSRTGKVWVRYQPGQQSQAFGSINIYLNEQGVHVREVVDLTGQGVQGLGILSLATNALNAGSFSFCSGDTTLLDTISNMGCDTLVISNIRFVGDGTFTLVSSGNDSLLLPGTSRVFEFSFAPRTKGAHAASLTFHSRNIVNDPGHDTTITLAGLGLGGTTMLSADTTLRNFGGIYSCQSRDTTITLYNTGCDTLVIEGGIVTNGSYATNAVYPIIIPPNDSTPVQVFLTPDSANMNGDIQFFSNANQGDSTVTIPLTANLLHPAMLLLSLSPSDTANAGQIVTCYIILEGQIPNGLISSLHFDITHNDDLLSYVNASGTGLSLIRTIPATGIVTQTFALSSIPNTDTIGTLSFQVYLTDSTSTSLALSNISFTTPGDLPLDCIASIGDSGASFGYLYLCGDRTIQDAMLGAPPFSITSIVPNPAQDEIEIRVAGGSIADDAPATQLQFEMYDALGRSVLTPASPQPLSQLGEGLMVDISNVPSGIYFLRVSAGGYMQSRSVVVQH